MEKVNYKNEFKQLYSAKPVVPVTVDVPSMQFLMVDGKGDPNTSQDYIDAIETLYPVAYTLKFTSKLQYGNDFTVMPLECLWWTKNMADFSASKKEDWLWTAMIMQPKVITKEIFELAVRQAQERRTLKAIDKLRFEMYHEGRSAQVLYIGPYSNEGPTILMLHEYIHAHGGTLDTTTKHHHEIYLSDPRRTVPERLKTIIRQPY